MKTNTKSAKKSPKMPKSAVAKWFKENEATLQDMSLSEARRFGKEQLSPIIADEIFGKTLDQLKKINKGGLDTVTYLVEKHIKDFGKDEYHETFYKLL